MAVHRAPGLGAVRGGPRVRGRAALPGRRVRAVRVLSSGARRHPRGPAAGTAGRALLRGAADARAGAAGGRGAVRRPVAGGAVRGRRPGHGAGGQRPAQGDRGARAPHRLAAVRAVRGRTGDHHPVPVPLVTLRTPPPAAVAQVLARDGVDPGRALAAARAAQGHIGRARRLATDPEAARRRDEVLAVPARWPVSARRSPPPPRW